MTGIFHKNIILSVQPYHLFFQAARNRRRKLQLTLNSTPLAFPFSDIFLAYVNQDKGFLGLEAPLRCFDKQKIKETGGVSVAACDL